jgi:hypothetical protein
LAGLAQVWFFVEFRSVLPQNAKPLLRLAALALAGALIAFVPKLLALSRLVPIPAMVFLQSHGPLISSLCPWLSALMLAVFCLLYRFSIFSEMEHRLRLAFSAGALGWLVIAISLSLVLANYLGGGGYQWMASLFDFASVVFVLTASFSFVGLVCFFLIFARGATLGGALKT